MARISLQNDNKISKSNKKSFFDLASATEISPEAEARKAITDTETEIKKEKKFKRGAVIAVIALAVLLLGAIIVSGIDILIDGKLNGIFNTENQPTKYDKYKPDWETDIFTQSDYLEKRPDVIKYSSDGGTHMVEVNADDIPTASYDVQFFYSYFDAIKRANTQLLNSFFTDSYLSENGEFGQFPMQKLYDIEVVKRGKSAEFEKMYSGVYDYAVYTVSYKIYRNDGLFCAEVDENHAREEIIVLVYNEDGIAQIDKRVDGKHFV